MKHIWIFNIGLLLIVSACAPSVASEPAPSATLKPSPVPITETSTLVPTETLVPTNTPMPTITPTPGPVSIKDDFTAKNESNWPDCDKCEWKDGQLHLGPYDPGTNLNESLKQVDRYFGILSNIVFGENNEPKRLNYLGISPFQAYTIRDYDNENQDIKFLAGNLSAGAVKPGRATNHFEVIVQPTAKDGSVDIYFKLNDSQIYIYYSQPVESSSVALGMSFHSVTVAYDNFEYEELPPK
jgi:hypothetical protein